MVERVPPKVQLENGIRTLYMVREVLLEHLRLPTLVKNGIPLPVSILGPPPFTV